MLKKTTILGVVFLSCLFWGSVSNAAVTARMATCSINQTQSTAASIYLRLTSTDGAFTNTWIRVDSDMANTALATALSAIAMDKLIDVRITEQGTSFEITAIRLNVN